MRRLRRIAGELLVWSLLVGCGGKTSGTVGRDAAGERQGDAFSDAVGLETPDWTWETHGKVEPDYEKLFESGTWNFEIAIAPEDWQILQQDMREHLQNVQPGPGIDLSGWNPVFVPCDVRVDGRTWYRVGIRVKGNSSLVITYRAGIQKFSFKLDFDEFEDVWPQIRDQRFYGFKQLNLENNFDDPSGLHEHLAMELFRDAGLSAPRTQLATVVLDAGDGPRYHGVYTLVEEPDDTLVKTAFSNGNLYKPDGPAGMFAEGTWLEEGYGKKNHRSLADYSDVRALYDALHSPDRLTAPEVWRARLEAAFDVPAFLAWLSANTVIQNWDSYGMAPHNYYLARSPDTGRLVWIPWDANEAFTNGRERGAPSLGLSEVDARWPLIRFLLDDPVYEAAYRESLRRFVEGPFAPVRLCPRIRDAAARIRDAARAERPPCTFSRPGMDFDAIIEELCARVTARQEKALDFLAQ